MTSSKPNLWLQTTHHKHTSGLIQPPTHLINIRVLKPLNTILPLKSKQPRFTRMRASLLLNQLNVLISHAEGLFIVLGPVPKVGFELCAALVQGDGVSECIYDGV